jgi:large subunit ribosomal protein L9
MHIAEELQKLGFDIDRKIIVVKDAKTAGDYVATVKLHKEVSAQVAFTVVAESNNESVAAQKEATVTEEVPAAEETQEATEE